MSSWERDDVAGILAGLFDMNAKLDTISKNVSAIRQVIDEDDEEEAPEDD